MTDEQGVKVSVVTTTYNHEEFIAQAIESVLAQVTDFEVEHIIGEDCSTDGTRQIVMGYQGAHPHRIRLLLRANNLGGRQNLVSTLRACRGQYVALLEGDDYWTLPRKLQLQADYLDAHPECAICFHNATKQYEAGSVQPEHSREPVYRELYTLEDLLERNFIRTCSVMFRNGLFGDFPEWYYTTPTGDWPLHVLNAHHGNVGYIDQVMAVHRVHAGSVWSPRSASDRRKEAIRTLEIFRQNLDRKYERKLEESIGRWHWKVLHAMALQKDYRGMGSYGIDLLLGRGGSRAAFLKASGWALQSKTG